MLIVTMVKPPHPIFACDFSHISFSETKTVFPFLQILECKLLLLIFADFSVRVVRPEGMGCKLLGW